MVDTRQAGVDGEPRPLRRSLRVLMQGTAAGYARQRAVTSFHAWSTIAPMGCQGAGVDLLESVRCYEEIILLSAMASADIGRVQGPRFILCVGGSSWDWPVHCEWGAGKVPYESSATVIFVFGQAELLARIGELRGHFFIGVGWSVRLVVPSRLSVGVPLNDLSDAVWGPYFLSEVRRLIRDASKSAPPESCRLSRGLQLSTGDGVDSDRVCCALR